MSNPPIEILSLAPATLLAWVGKRLSGEAPFEPAFNWHGLAEVAAANAHDQDASSIWAEIAVVVYSWLAQRAEPRAAASFTLSEMYVRANQVSRFGPCSGHIVRDPQVLITWFRNRRKLSYAEASLKAVNWRQLAVSEVAELRDIKNMLGVFKAILSHVSPADRGELRQWLELRPRLP